MRTKIIFIIFFFFNSFCISVYSQYGADDSYLDNIENNYEYLPIYTPNTGYIADLVLIYQGGDARLAYTKEQIAPYVYKTNEEGGIDWLFDGFLFLETRTFNGYAFEQSAYGHETYRARKQEWISLLDKVFEEGKAVSALNSVLSDLSDAGHTPLRKRKVIISLPEPLSGQKDWGTLNGKPLDFSIDADRLEALKWYVDEVIRRFDEHKYRHIELAGFYWLKESDDLSERLISPTSKYINSRGYILNWIPNWGPHRGENWRLRNFNSAYIQPNTFFSTGNSSNLPRVCTYAALHNMGLEVEFDWNLANESYQQKLHDYYDNFDKYKVLEKSAIAYYEGGRQFLTQLVYGTTPGLKSLYKRVTDVIIERQRRVDKMYIEDVGSPNNVVVNGGFEDDFVQMRKPGSPIFTLKTYGEPLRIANYFSPKTEPFFPKYQDVEPYKTFDTENGIWYVKNPSTGWSNRIYIDNKKLTPYGSKVLTIHNVGYDGKKHGVNGSAFSPFYITACQFVELDNLLTYKLQFSYLKEEELIGPNNTITDNNITRFVVGINSSTDKSNTLEATFAVDVPIPPDGDDEWKNFEVSIDLPALIASNPELDFTKSAILFGIQTKVVPDLNENSMMPGQISIDNVSISPVYSTPMTLLDNLSVSVGSLEPSFDKNVFSYVVNVDNDVDEIVFTASAVDKRAKITGVGEKYNLKVGENNFNIMVTSPDQSHSSNYSIKVVRAGRVGDVTLKSIIINGEVWDNLDRRYDLGTNNLVSLKIETTDPDAIVDLGNEYSEFIPKATLKNITFTVTSAGEHRSYVVKLERRYNFNDVVVVKWNNTLMANLKKIREDNFKVLGYQWYKNGVPITGANKPTYSVGNKITDVLDKNSKYHLELIMDEGSLRTTSMRPLVKDASIVAYPNPVSRGEKVILDANVRDDVLRGAYITIYNINGSYIGTYPVTGRSNLVTLPEIPGIYLLNFTGSDGLSKTVKVAKVN
ncbi:MAG: DUF4855 domain-containing protein [Fermentimonas sp.]|jgi:hypothetical protein